MTRSLAILVGGLLMVIASTGCNSTSGPIGGRGDELELNEQTDDGKAVIYRVDDKNVLHFAGGRDAQFGNITWSGELTPDEQDTLWRLVRDNGWMEKPAPEGTEPEDRTCRISVRMDGRRRTFTVKGACAKITPVTDVLEKASLRRFKTYIDTLPEPSIKQKIVIPDVEETEIEVDVMGDAPSVEESR